MIDTRPQDPSRRPAEDVAGPVGALARRRGLQSPNEALQPDIPPPPPDSGWNKKRPFLSAVSGFLTFLTLVVVLGLGAVGLGAHRMIEPGPLASDRVLVIAPHQEVAEILNQLQAEGVIDAPLLFNIALVLEGNRGSVKSGEYLFKQNASLQDVMDTLVSGKQVLHALTIPEGLTSQQIVQRLRDDEILSGEIREIPKEGTLLPDTYKFERGFSRAALLRKMQDDQRRVLAQIWARRSPDLILRTPSEVVTLASIVEKETGKADERPRVARVFLNRLAKRMRLQSDPTIVYGLVGGKATLGRGITRAELQQATPYNTYLIDGLPPTPIANPGRAALEAVINPARTNDLYFVADGSGGHAFASSLDEHNRNVTHWRQIERDKAANAQSDDETDRASPADTLPPPAAPVAPTAASPTPTPTPSSPGAGLPALRGTAPAVPPPAAAPRQQRGDLHSPSGLQAVQAVAMLDKGAPQGRAFRRFGGHGGTIPGLLALDEPKPAPFGAIVPAAPAEADNPFGKVVAVSPDLGAEPKPVVPPAQPQPVTSAASASAATAAPRMKAPKGFEATLGLQAKAPTPRGTALLDGPADNPGGDPPDMNAPISPKLRAELAASGALPQASGQAPARTPMPPINGRVRALDASEGTPIDPLLAKGWDLNSPQSIPVGVH